MAKALAEFLFDDGRHGAHDMTEYMEKHAAQPGAPRRAGRRWPAGKRPASSLLGSTV